MSACCVSGCKNRYSKTSKLQFFRIPSGSGAFPRYQRRSWLQAIKLVGSTEDAIKKARICGAHFISGEPSMNSGSPDFAPSVFICTKQRRTPKAKLERFSPHKKRRHHTVHVDSTVKRTCRRDDFKPEILQSSIPVEITGSDVSDVMPTAPSALTEGETLTEAVETGTNKAANGNRCINAMQGVNKTSIPKKSNKSKKKKPSFKVPASSPKAHKTSPTVLMPPTLFPAGGYQCDVCDENFCTFPQIQRHKQLHDEERPYPCGICSKRFMNRSHRTEHQRVHTGERPFPCNMCERAFTTNHNLKRHQLVHSKQDIYRCRKCSDLFCLRHNQKDKPALGPSVAAPPNPSSDWTLDDDLEQKSEPSQNSELVDDTHGSPTLTPTAQTVSPVSSSPEPSPQTEEPPPLTPHTGVLQAHAPPPTCPRPSSQPRPPPPPYTRTSPRPRPPPPPYPRTAPQALSPQPLSPQPLSPQALSPQALSPPPPYSRSSLQIFAPNILTSALLEVKRNWEYIFMKTSEDKKKQKKKKKKKKKDNMIEKRCDLSFDSKDEQGHGRHQLPRVAYDIEVVL